MSQPPPPQRPATAPPGWYFDGRHQRWWDGATWGPVAPDSNDRTLATLAHLGTVLGGFMLPLVLYLSSNDETRPETRANAREALNFQITFVVVYLLGFVGMFVGFGVGGLIDATREPGTVGAGIGLGLIIMFLFFVLVFVVSIGGLVYGIIAAVRANKGERYRYPFCIRFIGS